MATLVIYPDAGTGATTCDSVMAREGVDEAFSTIRAGAGVGSYPTSNELDVGLWGSTTNNQFKNLWRAGYGFNSAALGASAVISAANLSIVLFNPINTGVGALSYGVVGFLPSTNNDFVAADYGNFGTTRLASDIATASLVADGATYNDWALNATGLAFINKVGVTNLGHRFKDDIDGTTTQIVWSSNVNSLIAIYSADNAGTTKDPKLTITYTISSSIKKVAGVAQASISKISSVAIASIKKVAGVSNS